MRRFKSKLCFAAIAGIAIFAMSCSDESKPALNQEARELRAVIEQDKSCIEMTKNIGEHLETNKESIANSGKDFASEFDYKKIATYWWYLELTNNLRAIMQGVKDCTGDEKAKADALNALNSLKSVDGWDQALQIGATPTSGQ